MAVQVRAVPDHGDGLLEQHVDAHGGRHGVHHLDTGVRHLGGGGLRRFHGAADTPGDVDGKDLLVLAGHLPVSLHELAHTGLGGGGEAVELLELAEELLVGEVHPLPVGLVPEDDLERYYLDIVLAYVILVQVRGAVRHYPYFSTQFALPFPYVRHLPHPRTGRAGGLLFGLLLAAPLSLPRHLVPQPRLGVEELGVVRALAPAAVGGQQAPGLDGPLLQPGLVIGARALADSLAHALPQDPLHQLAGLLRAPVQVDRPDEGLHGVGQDGVLAARAVRFRRRAEQDVLPQARLARRPRQGRVVDQPGPGLGEVPFRSLRVAAVEVVGDHHLQHRVTQELQPLEGTGGPAALPVGVGAVGQGQLQQPLVAEVQTQGALEVPHALIPFRQALRCGPAARPRRPPPPP